MTCIDILLVKSMVKFWHKILRGPINQDGGSTYKAWIRQKLPYCRSSTGGHGDTRGYAGIRESRSIPSSLNKKKRNKSGYGIDTEGIGWGTREPASSDHDAA